MARCSAITRAGTRCRRMAIEGYEWCSSHDPNHAEARKKAASKGGKTGGRGRSTPGHNLAEIDRILKTMIYGVLTDNEDKQVDRADAAVVVQACHCRLRLVEVERRIFETEELEQKLEELEDALSRQGGSSWGA